MWNALARKFLGKPQILVNTSALDISAVEQLNSPITSKPYKKESGSSTTSDIQRLPPLEYLMHSSPHIFKLGNATRVIRRSLRNSSASVLLVRQKMSLIGRYYPVKSAGFFNFNLQEAKEYCYYADLLKQSQYVPKQLPWLAHSTYRSQVD